MMWLSCGAGSVFVVGDFSYPVQLVLYVPGGGGSWRRAGLASAAAVSAPLDHKHVSPDPSSRVHSGLAGDSGVNGHVRP